MSCVGDACDDDDDNDGVADAADNCQFAYNPGQENNDNDWIGGDRCDDDDDNDCVADAADNCQFVPNCGPSQTMEYSLCTNACIMEAEVEVLVDAPVGAYIIECIGEVSPDCFTDGCPWPDELQQSPFTDIATAFPERAGGLKAVGDKVRFPAEASGYADGQPLDPYELIGRGGRGGQRTGGRRPTPSRQPLFAGPIGQGMICNDLLDMVGQQFNDVNRRWYQCMELESIAQAQCQIDSDNDGDGDACDSD